jgi:hypothetical protein
MTDIADEIAEQVRRDQMIKMWQRYGKAALLASILALGAAGAYAIWHGQQEVNKTEETTALVTAVQQYTPDKGVAAAKALGQLAAGSWKAGFYEASILLQDNKPVEARAAYQRLAADKSVPAIYQSLAALLAAQSNLGGLDRATAEAELVPLAKEGLPWRHQARELLIGVALKAGDNTGAKQWLENILADAETPSGLRVRAGQMLSQLN